MQNLVEQLSTKKQNVTKGNYTSIAMTHNSMQIKFWVE